LLVLAWLPGSASADWFGVWHPTLTTAQQVRHLTPRQAKGNLPVKLTGVVTHVDAVEETFYLQDGTAGIFVLPTPHAKGLAQGDRVEVEGVTNEGEFAPSIAVKSLRRLGTEKLPDAHAFNLTVEDSRWLHAQWVQAWGVVRNARSEAGATYIDVYSSRGPAVLKVPGEDWAIPARAMRGETLFVRGVCAATFKDRRVSGPPTILLAELPKPLPIPTELLAEPDAPRRIIDLFLEFAPAPHPGTRRVKIAGVVTAAPLLGVHVIQDESAGALIRVMNPPVDIPIGTRVEAYGLLHREEDRRLALTQATLKQLEPAKQPVVLPEPVAVRAAELAVGARDAVRVNLKGRVESFRVIKGWTIVSLSEDNVRFEAFVPDPPDGKAAPKFELGSLISVVGVPLNTTPERAKPAVPGVFLNSHDAFALLEPPPQQIQGQVIRSWWTSGRAGYVFAGFAGIVLLGGGWLLALRVQVRRAAREVERQYEEKAMLERQLRQASKLEAVGRLAGGIAHDFNNLLTVINGSAELLAEQTARSGGEVAELTDQIRKAGERAASLTGQLLTFSRKRDVLIAAVNLNDVVADTVRLLERVIGEDIRIETNLGADLPPIRGEAGLLHQVVMNLAVNAKDAMPQGGVLSFRTSVVIEPVGTDAHSTTRQFVRLTVSDTGVGMTDEVKARLFEPFFTTKTTGGGTGLGLATVYGIVQTVRGKIRVDSAVGRGTTFTIDFRLHGEPVSDAEFAMPTPLTPLPPSRVVNATKLTGITVLLVEDNEMVRDMLENALKAEGATVLAASRPDHALQMLAAYERPVDVLVTDVVMPGMSGPVLAERVRETRPQMRVVFMSGHTADEVLRKGLLEEQVEFLQKPFTPELLVRRLQRLAPHDGTPASRE
jgi:signal transduction histidine kinase/ActR/RegA family two-component response regulator